MAAYLLLLGLGPVLGSKMWTACSYPRPTGEARQQTARANCSSTYLGLDYICDPAARVLDKLLSPHFVSCHCVERIDRACRDGLHRMGKARIAIAIVPLASLQGRTSESGPWELCPVAAERMDSTVPWDWISIFRDTLVQRWCPKADVFLTLVLSWYGWHGSFPATLVPGFFGDLTSLPSAANRLNHSVHIPRGRLLPTLRDYATLLAAEMARTQEERVDRYSTVQHFPTAHGIPGWAIGLCAGLIFVSLALLLIGNLVTSYDGPRRLGGRAYPPLLRWAIGLCAGLIFVSLALLLIGNLVTSYDGPRRLGGRAYPPLLKGSQTGNLRMANQRWEAQKAPDKGGKGKGRRGPWMFGQFRKTRNPSTADPPLI